MVVMLALNKGLNLNFLNMWSSCVFKDTAVYALDGRREFRLVLIRWHFG